MKNRRMMIKCTRVLCDFRRGIDQSMYFEDERAKTALWLCECRIPLLARSKLGKNYFVLTKQGQEELIDLTLGDVKGKYDD